MGLIAVLWLWLGAGPARAAEGEYVLTLGQSIILGDEADFLTDSLSFSLGYFRRFSLHHQIGAELGLSQGHVMKGHIGPGDLGDIDQPQDGRADSLAFTSGLKTKILWFTPVVKIGKAWEESHRFLLPYLIIGAGLYDVRHNGGGITVTGTTSAGAVLDKAPQTIAKAADQYFGANFGGGFTISMTDRLELSGDLRYHLVLRGSETLQFMFPGARLNYRFGGD